LGLYPLLKRIDSIVIAPISLALLFLMILSGYAMICPEPVSKITLNLIGFHNAYILHRTIVLPLWILTITHCAINMRPRLIKIIGRRIGETVNVVMAIVLVAIVVYLNVVCISVP